MYEILMYLCIAQWLYTKCDKCYQRTIYESVVTIRYYIVLYSISSRLFDLCTFFGHFALYYIFDTDKHSILKHVLDI